MVPETEGAVSVVDPPTLIVAAFAPIPKVHRNNIKISQNRFILDSITILSAPKKTISDA